MEDIEAPTPSETKFCFEEKCSIKIKQDEKDFILNFGTFGESIYFELYDLKIQNYKYMDVFSLENLKKINYFFNQFQYADKMIKVINNFMNSNKFKINDEKNESKTIYFSNPLDEEDIIYIELKMKEKSQKEIIRDLSDTVRGLKEKNSTLENKINTMDTLIKDIQKKYDEKILKLEESLKNINIKLEEENSIIQDNSIDSLIVSKKEDVQLLKEWISPNKKISFNLIYRATRDGDTINDFHRMCDDKSPTICIMKTPKGYIFGGYTTALFNSKENEELKLKDDKAFVFSLNKREKYKTQDESRSILISPKHLIIFGNGSNSIQIENNALSSKNHWSNPKGSYGYDLNLTEEKYFSIVEIEVFQIK